MYDPSSDEHHAFTGLQKTCYLLLVKFLRFAVEYIHKSEIMQKSCSVQNITRIIAIVNKKLGTVCLFVVLYSASL